MKAFNHAQIPAGLVVTGEFIKDRISLGDIQIDYGSEGNNHLSPSAALEAIKNEMFFAHLIDGKFLWVYSEPHWSSEDDSFIMPDLMMQVYLYTHEDTETV